MLEVTCAELSIVPFMSWPITVCSLSFGSVRWCVVAQNFHVTLSVVTVVEAVEW